MNEYKRIEIDGIRYYGKHLVLTASSCNENLLNKDVISFFMKSLVDKIDMVAFGEPIVERFGEGIEVGISAVQLIQTSAIVIHTNDIHRDMYLDVFSCKGFSEEIVEEYVKELFEAKNINSQILFRR